MPPSGTTGKSSSKSGKSSGVGRDSSRGLGKGAGGAAIGRKSSSAQKGGARGPAGPQGQARTSPAGGRPGAVSRTASKPAEKSFLGRANDTLRSLTGAERFERQRDAVKKAFAEKAPKTAAATEKIANAAALGAEYSPIGGPVVGMVKKATKAASQADKTAKVLSDLKKYETELSKYVKPGKIRFDENKVFRPSLAHERAKAKMVPGEKVWDAVESGIDKVTSTMGFGTGTGARTAASSTLGGVGAAQTAAINEGVAAYRDREKSKARSLTTRPAIDKSRVGPRTGPRATNNFLSTGPFTQPAIPRSYSKGGLAKKKNIKTRKK